MMEAEVGAMLFEDVGRYHGHKMQVASRSWNKQEKIFPLKNFRFLDYQSCKIVNLCCLKPLSV